MHNVLNDMVSNTLVHFQTHQLLNKSTENQQIRKLKTWLTMFWPGNNRSKLKKLVSATEGKPPKETAFLDIVKNNVSKSSIVLAL